jgi:APA family basic amino acid/polyamine antiporter
VGIGPQSPRSRYTGRPVSAPALARKLNLFDATMIVVSGIIGVGIFLNPYIVAQTVGTPFLILAVWTAGGAIALCGAFVFAELSTVMPRVGGQYAFFREAFHPLLGFLHGWSLLFIIQSGATAAVAVACGEYAARLLHLPPGLVTPLGIGILMALVAFHAMGIKPGAVLINIVTVGKSLAIGALIVGAFALARRSGLTFSPLAPSGLGGIGLVSAFFAALVPVMFTYGGWQNSCFVAEEVREPERNLPRAILIGVPIVIAIYLGANLAYVHVLGAAALAATTTPAADTAAALVGKTGGDLISALIVVSTFGFLNLGLMTAPRVYYAMARDGLFFRAVARVSPRTHAPVAAIVTQGVLASGLAVFNAYKELVGYAVFADWIFFALAGVALMVFRRKLPDAPRPFATPLYPLVPLAFIAAGIGIVGNMFVSDPKNAIMGTCIIALGVPVYFIWRRLRTA